MKQFLESTTEGVRPPCPGCKGEGGRPRRGCRGIPGLVKPNIVFYGEPLPPSFEERRKKDKGSAVDLVIVIGTSLTVGPVNQLISDLPPAVPRINISKTPIDPRITFDIQLIGPCDVVTSVLCQRLGWSHENIPTGKRVQVQELDVSGQHRFTEVLSVNGCP